jgi:septal ring-binding cell division protein DamX
MHDKFQLESWINNQRSHYWTVQLLAFTHESKVQEFIVEHGLQSKAAYFVEKKDDVVWYKLIYGSFDSKDKATFARQNLSTKLQEFGPWLRTIASVQAITKG